MKMICFTVFMCNVVLVCTADKEILQASTTPVAGTNRVITSMTVTDTPITNTHSVIPLLSTETSEKPFNCPSGFVQCVDGNCEPYESLCGEAGIVTVTFPTDITTNQLERSTTPFVGGSSIGSFESSTSVTESLHATTRPTVQVTTTPVYIATDSTGHEICLDGWEMCMDGTCEPFHWLCTEHDGSANLTTIMVTEGPTTKHVTTKLSNVVTTDLTKSTEPMVQMTTPVFVTETIVNDTVPQLVTSSSGTCPSGFVQCVDGTCEPFEALCGEGGIVTVTFQTIFSTTGNTSPLSGSSGASKSTFETTSTSTSTTTFAVVTDSNGKEVCADGWEQCKDGTCEPFHWLCTEHDGSSPIIG